MTFTATIITALIAGGIAFLLGWVICKAVLAQHNTANDSNRDQSSENDTVTAVSASADLAGLQMQIERLQHDKAELNAKISRYEDRINEQVRMLANLQEDRDRIRVEHGSQKRLIHTLQQTGLNKDQARQSMIKQQQAYEEQIRSLEQQIAALEKTAGKAPVPTMLAQADGISLRDQLLASKNREASLTAQLQALQEWAKPLATENTQQAELIERLKYQVGALRTEQQVTKEKLRKLSAAISSAKVAQRQRAADVTGTYQQTAVNPGTVDNVVAPGTKTDAVYDALEETHTDLEAADDLKKIRGIGPGLERRFNAAGVFSYAQLAELSHQELQKIAARTKKAHRASWAQEARRLHELKPSSNR
jgi:predicted flap endonuclease-1-like 5' DNA nuclease